MWLQDVAWLCVDLGAVEFHSSARLMVHLVPGITTSLLRITAAKTHGWCPLALIKCFCFCQKTCSISMQRVNVVEQRNMISDHLLWL